MIDEFQDTKWSLSDNLAKSVLLHNSFTLFEVEWIAEISPIWSALGNVRYVYGSVFLSSSIFIVLATQKALAAHYSRRQMHTCCHLGVEDDDHAP